MKKWNDKRVDDDGVWLMTKPVKIYVFKDENKVKVTFRMSDYSNYSRQMSIDEFTVIANDWEKGVEGLRTKDGKFYWYLSRSGPRPERVPARFVCVNINSFHFRFSVPVMEELVAEFYRQLTEENHWD